MQLKLKQHGRVGVMGRKFTQGTQCITELDLEQVDQFAKKYQYEIGYCDVQLIHRTMVVDECVHVL